MLKNKALRLQIAIASAATLLIGTSAFAESRHLNGTSNGISLVASHGGGGGHGGGGHSGGGGHASGGMHGGGGFSHGSSGFSHGGSYGGYSRGYGGYHGSTGHYSSPGSMGRAPGGSRYYGGTHSTNPSGSNAWRNGGSRNYSHGYTSSGGNNAYNNGAHSQSVKGYSGGSNGHGGGSNGNGGHAYGNGHGGNSYHNGDHFHGHGQVDHYYHYHNGYCVYLTGWAYPFWVPYAYWNPYYFGAGFYVGFNAYWDPTNGYYSVYNPYYSYAAPGPDEPQANGPVVYNDSPPQEGQQRNPDDVQTGDTVYYQEPVVRGTIQRMDFVHDTMVVNDEITKKTITVLMPGARELNSAQAGDYIEVSGTWRNDGVFDANSLHVYQPRHAVQYK